MAYDETLAERIRAMLNGPNVEERKMFGGLAFLVGGRMCCGVQGTDLMTRVPAESYERALHRPYVRPMDFTGKPLKGFVYVSADGVRTVAALRRWIALGLQAAEKTAAAIAERAPRRRRRRDVTRASLV